MPRPFCLIHWPEDFQEVGIDFFDFGICLARITKLDFSLFGFYLTIGIDFRNKRDIQQEIDVIEKEIIKFRNIINKERE